MAHHFHQEGKILVQSAPSLPTSDQLHVAVSQTHPITPKKAAAPANRSSSRASQVGDTTPIKSLPAVDFNIHSKFQRNNPILRVTITSFHPIHTTHHAKRRFWLELKRSRILAVAEASVVYAYTIEGLLEVVSADVSVLNGHLREVSISYEGVGLADDAGNDDP